MFSFLNYPRNLDLSSKMDLGIKDYFGKNNPSYNYRKIGYKIREINLFKKKRKKKREKKPTLNGLSQANLHNVVHV